MDNDKIALCDYVLKIDTNRKFSSLNLSHAVNLICYEISKFVERTKDINKAEIISERGDTGNENWVGVASWTNEEKVWRLCVKEGTGKKLKSTMVHEFAHALGMAHPENHWTTTDTVMSYGRNKKKNPGLYPRDIDILTGLYID